MICRQLYINIPSIIPISYANPDSCDDKALRTYYRVTDSTLSWGAETINAPKRIALNTRTDYDRYTREQQEQFGAYYGHSTIATQAGGVIDKPDTYLPKRLVDANDEEEERMSLAVAVYPNPARGEFGRVRVRSSYGDAPVSLALYDLTGHRVIDLGTMTLRSGEGSGRLEVGRLRPGVYVLSARQGSRTASTRVTVVR